MEKYISNWGKYPRKKVKWEEPSHTTEAAERISGCGWIARGMGRCYGDAALAENVLSTRKWNRFLNFDPASGLLTCEAGVSFDEILQVFVPKGYFLPVTPGTRFVSVGGAIASDVHGKNHHSAGTFSEHLRWLDLLCADGQIRRCSREENTELFLLSCGGMGLTGVILRAAFYLKPIESAYIRQHMYVAKDLDRIMELFDTHKGYSNSVAWIDCLQSGKYLGRSLLMAGDFAKKDELPQQINKPLQPHKKPGLIIPFDFPTFTLNSFSVKAFNYTYYQLNKTKAGEKFLHYEPFYYPLDAIHHWNRIYGKNGFTQYQFVLPLEQSRAGLIEMLEYIGKKRMGSFLSVLKLFGKQDENYLRFPMEGYTLALDFKITPGLWAFLNQLDEKVEKYGGRVYLTKDVRMPAEMLYRTYPQAGAFRDALKKWDPEGRFASEQSKRLKLHE